MRLQKLVAEARIIEKKKLEKELESINNKLSEGRNQPQGKIRHSSSSHLDNISHTVGVTHSSNLKQMTLENC